MSKDEPRDILILSLNHRARGGYYAELEAAGRYTRTEAKSICEYGTALPFPISEVMECACTVVDPTSDLFREMGERYGEADD
jgi:transketolase N-terminal domain/subunit